MANRFAEFATSLPTRVFGIPRISFASAARQPLRECVREVAVRKSACEMVALPLTADDGFLPNPGFRFTRLKLVALTRG